MKPQSRVPLSFHRTEVIPTSAGGSHTSGKFADWTSAYPGSAGRQSKLDMVKPEFENLPLETDSSYTFSVLFIVFCSLVSLLPQSGRYVGFWKVGDVSIDVFN